MNTPIIFVHKSNSYYLHAALLKAHMTNPNRDIILIGDEANDRYDFVKHYQIDDFMQSANRFAKVYVHKSPNPQSFELFCFQRWFVLRDFSERILHTGEFLYCDTDTLLFVDIESDVRNWRNYDFTICRTGTPCFTFFKKGGIKRFTDFIYERYSTPEGLKMINSYAASLQLKNKKYGISDMTAFMAYEKLPNVSCLHIDHVVEGECYAHNYRDADDGYAMKDGHYALKEGNDAPKCKNLKTEEIVVFKGLHCQGGMKRRMPNFFSTYWHLRLRLEDYWERILYKLHKC